MPSKSQTFAVSTGRAVTAEAAPIRVAIEAWDFALCLFSQSERNLIVRSALYDGGEYWRTVFLPLRFSPYAKTLGYAVTKKWELKKGGPGTAIPLVWTGDLHDIAVQGAHVEARADASTAAIIIRIPVPRYANQQPMVYKVLRSIPAIEVERIAAIVLKSIAGNAVESLHADSARRGQIHRQRKVDFKARVVDRHAARQLPIHTPRQVA